jgi:hypothetical protein
MKISILNRCLAATCFGAVIVAGASVTLATAQASAFDSGLAPACFGAVAVACEGVTQAASPVSASDQVHLNVSGETGPTTRVLAIGRWTPKATIAGVRAVIQTEVRDTVRLYLDGVIDQWFVQQDNTGVVFLLNITDPEKARMLLEKLPLGQAGQMEFQLMQLGPTTPLGSLIGPSAK